MAKQTGIKATEEALIEKAVVTTEKVAEEKEVKSEDKAKRGRRPSTATTAKKVAAKPAEKASSNEFVFVQFAGRELTVNEIMERARQEYIIEGHRATSIKSLRLYIKPEEMKAYYVINDNNAGCIDL